MIKITPCRINDVLVTSNLNIPVCDFIDVVSVLRILPLMKDVDSLQVINSLLTIWSALTTNMDKCYQMKRLNCLKTLEDFLLYHSKDDNVVYFGYIGDNMIKFGVTDNIGRRTKEHKEHFTNFHLIHVVKCVENRKLESKIKRYMKEYQSDNLVKYSVKDKVHNEIIELDKEFDWSSLIKAVHKLRSTFRDYDVTSEDFNALRKQVQEMKLIHSPEKKNKKEVECNHIGAFVEDCLEDASTGILIVDVYPIYVRWFEVNSISGDVHRKCEFMDLLKRLYKQAYSRHVRVKGRRGGQLGIREVKLTQYATNLAELVE